MSLADLIVVEFDLKEHSFKSMNIQELIIHVNDINKIYWIHCNLSTVSLDEISKKLNLPEEVIKMCKAQDPLPKFIDEEESLTLEVQAIQSIKKSKLEDPHFDNIIIHLTHRYCFTATLHPLESLTRFQESFAKGVRYAKTPCFILFLILDDIVNEYSKTLFNFELLAEKLDLQVNKKHKDIYDRVMDVKQEVMKVKRYNVALREILMRISGRSIPVISEQCRLSLSNVSSHTHMIAHEADSIRDMLTSLLDQIENSLMQKMNESMRILTAFASILLPLSLITGIYGMNFKWMPELEWKYGYFAALGLIVFVGLGLLYIFKKKHWF